MIHRLHRAAELRPRSGLYFDEGYCPVPLYHQIDVAMTAAEAALNHAPATPPEPPLRDSLPKFTERLPSR